MLRSAYIGMIYLSFIALGVSAPFVLCLGYVWVDTFNPQAVAYTLLNEIPVSLIMAVSAIGGFLVLERRKGGLTLLSVLLLAFAFWVTVTTAMLAEVPTFAWVKWNYAFKTLCFAAFVPFVFRSRVQIEAFLQIYLFSLFVHFFPVGVKTLVSGGGYGRELGVVGGNSLLSEGSTLAAVSLMLVPIILYLRRRTTILPRNRHTDLGYLGLAAIATAAAIGTYERTALIGIAVVGIGLWLRARRKGLFGVLGLAGIALTLSFSGGAWSDRISTVTQYNSESSALGRILVWKWTWSYVNEHPLGGGFDVYRIDKIEFPAVAPGSAPEVVKGKAFHSIYFEVLGEQGFPGLGLFLLLIITTLWQLHTASRICRQHADLGWARDLAFTLQISLLTLLACGSFIGIAFQPMIYNLLAISACLCAHVRHIGQQARKPIPALRPMATILMAN